MGISIWKEILEAVDGWSWFWLGMVLSVSQLLQIFIVPQHEFTSAVQLAQDVSQEWCYFTSG